MQVLINTGLINSLLPDGTKSLFEPTMTDRQYDPQNAS